MAPGDLASRIKGRPSLVLLAGSALTGLSLAVPWWSLHSSIVNGQQSLFDFTVGPRGMTIGTPIGDPSTLLAGFQVVYWIVAIALLPVSVSLGLAAFHGVYCVLRGRGGARVLIAPLWAVIGLVWWAFYFLLVSSFFTTLGLDIPSTGSADITWQSYQLVGATWGWDLGLWLGIAGTIVLFAGAALSFRGGEAKAPVPEGTKLAFGFHGVGLILLAVVNLGALGLLLVSLRNPGIAWLILVPVFLLFAMALFARRPKVVAISRTSVLPPLPKMPKVNLSLPRMTPTAPAVRCDMCGQAFPTQVQLDAHRLGHRATAQVADAKAKLGDAGRRLFGR